MHTKTEPGISLIKGGANLRFLHNCSGLYHCTIDSMNKFHTSLCEGDPSISLLASRESSCTNSQLQKASRVHELKNCMMWSSKKTMKKILANEHLKNLNLTVNSLNWAFKIYGEAPEILAGKTTAPTMVKNSSSQVMLYELSYSKSRWAKLYVDIFYVNGLAFLHIKSKEIDYITIQRLTSKKGSEICKKSKLIIFTYLIRGFTITNIFL